jgi:hypothetical protein
MRPDMFEVIIERPRGGARGGIGRSKPGRRPRDRDEWPRNEPMRMRDKFLRENLAPLRRFLASRVGRDWNEVHSEICATLSVRSAVQKHVLDHLRHMVELDVMLVDGRPHHVLAQYHRRGEIAHGCLYVCPLTRRLLRVPVRRRHPPPPAPVDRLTLGPDRQAHRVDGVWYLVRLARVPPTARRVGLRDALLHQGLHEPSFADAAYRAYGRVNRYAVEKRQIGKRELRELRRRLDEQTAAR